jgi:peptidyl-tRNA hydrolase
MNGHDEVFTPLKLYIMVPDEMSCKLPTGKIMAHAAHNAAIITYEHKGMQRVDEWYHSAMTKIVVRVPWTVSELKEIVNDMRLRGYPAAMIEDNQVGTEICAAIGPFSDEEAEYFHFNELKLL